MLGTILFPRAAVDRLCIHKLVEFVVKQIHKNTETVLHIKE